MVLGVEIGEAEGDYALWLEGASLLHFADGALLLGSDGKDDVIVIQAADMVGRYVGEGVEDMDEGLDAFGAGERVAGSADIGSGREHHLSLDLGQLVEGGGLVHVEEARVHVVAVDEKRGVMEVHRIVGEMDLTGDQFGDYLLEGSPVVLAFAEDGDIGLNLGGGLLADEAVEERFEGIERRSGDGDYGADEGAARTWVEIC